MAKKPLKKQVVKKPVAKKKVITKKKSKKDVGTLQLDVVTSESGFEIKKISIHNIQFVQLLDIFSKCIELAQQHDDCK